MQTGRWELDHPRAAADSGHREHAEGDTPMRSKTLMTLVAAALAIAAGAATAQDREVQSVHVARADRWDPGSPDGFCRLRLFVDDNARVELHGDEVIVRTNSGRRAYDTGSTCNQPLPTQPVADFRVTSE